jgi:hypothetical protein
METPVKPLQDGKLLYFGVLTACDAGKKLSNAENRIHLNQLANVGTGSYYGGNCSFKAQGLFFRIHALSGSPSACPERTLTKHLECCTALDEIYHMGSYNLVLSNKAPAIKKNTARPFLADMSSAPILTSPWILGYLAQMASSSAYV